jgi:uncharacterized membrane protein YfcA
MEPMDNLIAVGLAFAFGGILKGATGAGTPLVAVPLLALLYDVRFAVAVFVMSNLVSSGWQLWQYREHHVSAGFSWRFALAGGVGAIVGSFALVSLASNTLLLIIATSVLAYIGFRLFRPGWKLPLARAMKWVLPAGFSAGALLGATGIAAPVSITFLSAMRLEREQFIASITGFFLTVAIIQLIVLTSLGVMTLPIFLYGCLALVPLLAAMPVGAALVRYVHRDTFDKLIMTMLFVLAIKMLFDGLTH